MKEGLEKLLKRASLELEKLDYPAYYEDESEAPAISRCEYTEFPPHNRIPVRYTITVKREELCGHICELARGKETLTKEVADDFERRGWGVV